MFPLNIFAYSESIVPGGENIGITIDTKGLIVVGFYKVEGEFIGKENLKIGDTIIEIEGIEINSIDDMIEIINEKVKDNRVNITIIRNNKKIETYLPLINVDNVYKTGLYVKESVTGIGTLTYIDPVTKVYGALGHEIILSSTNKSVEVKSGIIYDSFVKSVDRSISGKVGSKNASIRYNNKLGTIIKNTPVGLYGKYVDSVPKKDLMEVANFNEIELGEAYIYTNIEGNEVKTFRINITSINKSKIKTSKSINFKIEDDELVNKTGGIIQGMSGSPIIQNNKVIGAVTHVVVSSPMEGYGVFIRTMLEEGEK
jgi:stage IV sporulation protein B